MAQIQGRHERARKAGGCALDVQGWGWGWGRGTWTDDDTDLAKLIAHVPQLPLGVDLQQKLVVADEGTCGATTP